MEEALPDSFSYVVNTIKKATSNVHRYISQLVNKV
jgi:hypothetical protein